MAPLVINEIFIICVSPKVAPYSALVIIPAKPIFFEAVEVIPREETSGADGQVNESDAYFSD